MMELAETIQIVLQDAGYNTRLGSLASKVVVAFEDDALLGFACIFDNANSLLTEWEKVEASLLIQHAPQIRAAADKAWNIYCVFLTTGTPDDIQSREIRWIEENLERTRKIAAAGLSARADAVNALLPVLPIVQKPALVEQNLSQRISQRINAVVPNVAEAVLNENLSATDVIRIIQRVS